jgi:hypothetical protein
LNVLLVKLLKWAVLFRRFSSLFVLCSELTIIYFYDSVTLIMSSPSLTMTSSLSSLLQFWFWSSIDSHSFWQLSSNFYFFRHPNPSILSFSFCCGYFCIHNSIGIS